MILAGAHRRRTASVTLTSILGAEPQVYLHADDLAGADASAVGAWAGRTTHSATGVSSPTLQLSGYDGSRKAVRTTSGGAYVAMHDGAADYPSSRSPFFWALACNVGANITARDLIALGSSTVSSTYQRIGIGSSTDLVQALGREDTAVTVTGTAFAEDVPSILAACYDGDLITVVQRTSGGDDVVIDDELLQFTASDVNPFDRFALGALVRSTVSLNTTMDVRCFVALANATISPATIPTALDFIQNQLDCPV